MILSSAIPEIYSFSCSRDKVGAHQNLNGSRDLTTPLQGQFASCVASTCYYQPIYQILMKSLSLPTTNIWKAIQNSEKWGGMG